jgi:hypothetical protein
MKLSQTFRDMWGRAIKPVRLTSGTSELSEEKLRSRYLRWPGEPAATGHSQHGESRFPGAERLAVASPREANRIQRATGLLACACEAGRTRILRYATGP